MNISQAKLQVNNALKAYLTKDEFNNYKIPSEAQRPIFLMGPPGIGKTAIVKQLAEEMNLGFVSYSITHHTRQSALGLPMIRTRNYDGVEYNVSEYTMSEIIASVFNVIEESGAREGILFLDEINCASETLTPVMLQFLQFKTFGKHRLPEGWVIVTAGNPTEFNRSAREFDIVTWDRLKRINIEPDYQSWKLYAQRHKAHEAILSYLDIRKEYFYKLETTPEGSEFVTARGWLDLSDMLQLYEENNLTIDINLISQYIQNQEIAEDFTAYYDLFNKYKSDYQIEEILNGAKLGDIILRAKDAAFDERLSLLGLLLGSINHDFRNVIEQEDIITELLPILKSIKAEAPEGDCTEHVVSKLEEELHRMDQTTKRGIMTPERRMQFEKTISFLKSLIAENNASVSTRKQLEFGDVKDSYDKLLATMKSDAARCSDRLKALFSFIRDAFGQGDELLILITELTSNWYSARFISRYGSEDYYACSEQLAFHQRHLDLIEQLSIWGRS